MFNHRFRIIVSIAIAFIIVNIYGRLSTTPFIKKNIMAETKNLLSKIKFPSFNLSKLFTLKFNQENDNFKNNSGSFYLPTVQPTPTLPVAVLTKASLTPTGLRYPTINPSIRPSATSAPQSTPTPKPTKPPKPTPTPLAPAITSSIRPGSTLKEIYEDVQDRMCVPAALLYAFQQAETGAWWPVNSASSKVKTYNKYGWWIDGSGSSCTGMGYHTQTGIVPSDAVDAGTVCQNPIPSGADQAIMGLWQISKYEEDAAKKYMTKIIKGNIDRRVIFDNAIIFAIITKNRLGSPPKNCSDWPADAIKTAAEKHYGTCGDNYCNKVLNYYKQY